MHTLFVLYIKLQVFLTITTLLKHMKPFELEVFKNITSCEKPIKLERNNISMKHTQLKVVGMLNPLP